MADIGGTGNFDPKAKKISVPKSTDKKNIKPSANEVENNHRDTHLKKIRQENQGRYLNASDAQKFIPRASREKHLDEFSAEPLQEDDDIDLITPFKAKEEKEKALIKNPLLKSKLDLISKSDKPQINDHHDHGKSKPPKPSLKSLLAPKGNRERRERMDLLESSRDLEFLISYHVLGIRRKIFPRECFPELRKASPAGKKRKKAETKYDPR